MTNENFVFKKNYSSCFLLSYKNPARWKATFGVTLSNPKMKRDLRRIIVHDKYNYPAHDYDIAVAELSSPVPYTNAVHRVCLPDASHEFRPGDEMFVTGFGALHDDGEHLKKRKISLVFQNIPNSNLVFKDITQNNIIKLSLYKIYWSFGHMLVRNYELYYLNT